MKNAARFVALVFSVPEDVSCTSSEIAKYILTAQTGFVCQRTIVTVAHGLTEGRVCIATRDGIYETKVKGVDSKWDLAFLEAPSEMRDLEGLGLDETLDHVGELVLVIGMNRGSLNPYVALGIVSSEGMNVKVGNKLIEGALQIHTYVPRGTSGSPVVNARGKVVGVMIGVDFGGSVAYAIPSIVIARDLHLVKRGVSPDSRPILGIKALVTSDGLRVIHVSNGSIAARAGVAVGDLIEECTACGKRFRVRDLWDLWGCIDEAALCTDKTISLSIRRRQTVKRIEVVT